MATNSGKVTGRAGASAFAVSAPVGATVISVPPDVKLAADFRDAAGIGRNIAIDVLEYFDAKRLTRRQGETRAVVGDPAALFGS